MLLTFWFLLVCPGMAFIRLLQLKKIYQEWTLAIALSIALDGLIASLLIYTHHWSVAAGLIILILLSAAGALLQVRLPGPQPIEA